MKLITNLYSFLVNFSWFLPHCLLLISFIILCLIFITLTWNRLRIFNFFLPSFYQFFSPYPDFFKNRKQHLPSIITISHLLLNCLQYVVCAFPPFISLSWLKIFRYFCMASARACFQSFWKHSAGSLHPSDHSMLECGLLFFLMLWFMASPRELVNSGLFSLGSYSRCRCLFSFCSLLLSAHCLPGIHPQITLSSWWFWSLSSSYPCLWSG